MEQSTLDKQIFVRIDLKTISKLLFFKLIMDEHMPEKDSTSRLIENDHCQNDNKDNTKCHNFSIESILSSASSAFTVASSKTYENTLNLHSDLIRKGNPKFGLKDDKERRKNETSDELDRGHDDIDDEEEDVDVESRSPSPPLHSNSTNPFEIDHANQNLPMFGFSKGN